MTIHCVKTTMSLRSQIAVLLSVLLVSLMVTTYTVHTLVVMPAFAKLERDAAERDLDRCRDAVDRAVVRQDRVGLVRIAHTLKGVTGNLAATKLHELTAKIDRDYRQADSDCESLLRDVSTLRREMERCLVAVPELRRSMQNQVSPHSAQ